MASEKRASTAADVTDAGLGTSPASRLAVGLLVVAAVGLVFGVAGLIRGSPLGSRASGSELALWPRDSAIALNRTAIQVARGLPPDFAELADHSGRLEDFVGGLRGVAVTPDLKPRTAAIFRAWTDLKPSLDSVLSARQAVEEAVSVHSAADQSGVQVGKLYQDVLNRLVQGVTGPDRIVVASSQLARAERIRLLGYRLLGDGRDADLLATRMVEEIQNLARAHTQLQGDGPVGAYLREQRAAVDELLGVADRLNAAGPALGAMQRSAVLLADGSAELLSAGQRLDASMRPPEGSALLLYRPVLLALAVGLGSLLLSGTLLLVEARARIRRAERSDRGRQQAIESLLDDIGALADGDLTVRASVGANFTGAIAESVNATVDTLRGLVGTINETATDIGGAASSTQETAAAMQAASESQAADVSRIAGNMQRSADSLSEVAMRAEALSQQASASVDDAHKGASTVGRTIQGMSALREQIQDTAKRIKRLAESSQEIGNIVEVINDISEETNTLALNASIQTAMARDAPSGQSGRGFTTLADDVQRLAERTAAATHQIEILVKTIQADTNEAIVSMERSTSNVVAGARSAEEAGQALTRIESASTDLARLIHDISSEARAEAAQATRFAAQIESIRDSAIGTAASAQKTADAVEDLNKLSSKLRNSVAGFRLSPGGASSRRRILPKSSTRPSG
ncbi:MAG: methyl-accepting chemotaxis protein [Panacagrimonas sp.]